MMTLYKYWATESTIQLSAWLITRPFFTSTRRALRMPLIGTEVRYSSHFDNSQLITHFAAINLHIPASKT